MITALTIVIFISCFLFYSTSEKVALSNKIIVEKALPDNVKYIKIAGLVGLLISFITSISIFGFTSGIIYGVILLMISLSLLVLLYPLSIFNNKLLFTTLVLLFLIELIFSYAS